MVKSYGDILREHLRRYPLMQNTDFAKLLYQAEFGPQHLAHSDNSLTEEWRSLPPGLPPNPPLPISSELCRFPLPGAYSEPAAALLQRLLQLTAQRQAAARPSQPGLTGLTRRAQQLLSLLPPDRAEQFRPWLAEWLQNGAPVPHHSEIFRQNYQPHYRVLNTEYAGFFPALLAIQSAQPPLIAIDGRCGSGKTSLARLIAQVWPGSVRVAHIDDFYLPPAQRIANWQQQPAANLDLPRLQSELLAAAQTGAPIVYRPYDCQNAAYGEPRQLPPAKITVIEGSYALLPQLAAAYTLKIFLTVSPEVQAERLQAREGGYYPAFVERWIPLEEKYLRQNQIEKTADILINTDDLF